MKKLNTNKLESIIELLLTDHCNQNCSFCFAREEMKSPLKKEMSISDIKMVKKQLLKNGILNVALTGGEPTLHTHFIEVVNLMMDEFFRININTNGTFSDEITAFLKSMGKRVTLFFNVSTPGFLLNKKMRKKIIERIDELSDTAGVSVVITSKFNSAKEAKMILDLLGDKIIKKVTVRLGVEGVIAGAGNYNSIEDFPLIGPHFIEAYKYAARKKPKDIRFGKSITPCMFSTKDLRFLKKKGYMKTVHCHPESEGRWFGINPAMQTFMCYPLSTRDRLRITPNSDLKRIKKYYLDKQRKYKKKYVLPQCLKCPFYGLEEDKCPGPCAGYRINALEERERSVKKRSLHSSKT